MCGRVVTGKGGKTKEVVKDREVKTVVGKVVMYVCMCACMYVCMDVCMHACMHVCMHGPQARYFFFHERRRRRVRDEDGKVPGHMKDRRKQAETQRRFLQKHQT